MTALLLIDLQKGFNDFSYWGVRNNPELEQNIIKVLHQFREKKLPIIHVQHLSQEPKSPLRPGQIGVEFMDFAIPLEDEVLFQKNVNSAFIGTNLEAYLRQQQIQNLYLVGLTSDHCVSTTARMASNLGFEVTIIHSATATFSRIGFNGEFYSAEIIHNVSLASLNREFAKIISHTDLNLD